MSANQAGFLPTLSPHHLVSYHAPGRPRHPAAIHENHEAAFMIFALPHSSCSAMLSSRARTIPRLDSNVLAQTCISETTMIWETPTAIDFRFGMEITMYIANR